MKFVVSSTALLNVLQTLSKVVSNKNTLPILDNFLFDLKDGVLKITASDLETTLIGSLPVENMEEAGLMAVPVKLMLDSLKEFSEQPLSIEANESTWEINISWKTGKLTIPGTSGLSYPNLPELKSDNQQSLSIDTGTLLCGINKTIFATADEVLFGCQPSLEFSRIFSGAFWSEAFCMGYYAYYYMMALMVFFYLLFRYDQFERASFVFLSVFFVYYLIFDFLPVAGPQYYFKAIGIDNALAGHFPELGHYFQTHLESLRLPSHGIFSELVAGAQEVGERPTAAFPSSHVGMSTVTMILVWKTRNRWLFWCLMPFFILLCCATVYIKAHYLVDSIAGLITAFIFYYLADWCYSRFSKSMPLLHRAR